MQKSLCPLLPRVGWDGVAHASSPFAQLDVGTVPSSRRSIGTPPPPTQEYTQGWYWRLTTRSGGMRCTGTSSPPAPLPARGCTRVSTGSPATSPTRSRAHPRSALLSAACCCRGCLGYLSPTGQNRRRAELAPSRAHPATKVATPTVSSPPLHSHLSWMRVAPPFVRPYSAAAMRGLDARCIIAHGACRASTPTQVLKRP